jgi:hypothetical protein
VLDRRGGARCQRGQALRRRRLRTGQKLAFGAVALQRERERMLALPAILRQQCRTCEEIGER